MDYAGIATLTKIYGKAASTNPQAQHSVSKLMASI